jgi:predicted RNase H-like nuclease
VDGWLTIGIDPAPGKNTVVWTGGASISIPAHELRGWVERQIRENDRVLIAWDSPLSFDAGISSSDRPVDRAVRSFIAEQTKAGGLQPRAVSVRTFSGCPHWTISCQVLGLPFGHPPDGLRLAAEEHPRADERGAFVVEVHPAVTLAIWWLERAPPNGMPRYKGDGAACVEIARVVGMSPTDTLDLDDDKLDAWVAWRMADDFLGGHARWVGSPTGGGYVLPSGALTRWDLPARVVEHETKMRRGR